MAALSVSVLTRVLPGALARWASVASLACGAFHLLVAGPATAAPPAIDHIERFSSNAVLVHFNTEPNRNYTLQYLSSLNCTSNQPARCNSSGVPTNLWTDLFFAPAFPFSNHFVIYDVRTNQLRSYRLKVKP